MLYAAGVTAQFVFLPGTFCSVLSCFTLLHTRILLTMIIVQLFFSVVLYGWNYAVPAGR